jgi:hypothetical protein
MSVHKAERKGFRHTKDVTIERTVEVISMLEKMAEENKKIDTRFIKNTVVNNLLDRKKELNKRFKKNKEYWSIQLLAKLGLLSAGEELGANLVDQEKESEEESDVIKIDADTRN